MGFSSTLLTNRTILITGAGKGIGRECALLAAACGANVIAEARTETDLVDLQAASEQQNATGQIGIWPADIQQAEFLHKVKALPALHGLINNVGTNRVALMQEQPDEDLDAVLDLNLKSLYRTAKAALVPMSRSEQPAIVNMSSQMGFVGSPKRTLYCMSKHGVEGLTKAMSVELASQHIRVNSVAPTFVLTPLTQPMFENPEFKQFVLDMIPMQKLATVEDVANACVFLLSHLSAMVTGTVLKVDGGWTAR